VKRLEQTFKHLRYSFRPPLLVGFPEGYQILYALQPIRDASGHSRGRAKCTMNLDEVVGKIIEGCGSRVILHLPAESIREARVTAHGSAYRPILPFHKTC
jgi:hypothetical protein